MGRPKRIHFSSFEKSPLVELASRHPQASYVADYLGHLSANLVLKEDGYFDRDYLSEFQAFYCTSSASYPNQCYRLHFFARPVTERDVLAASGGNKTKLKLLRANYLGFSVVRPVRHAPLGRTVLKWYPDQHIPQTPRNTHPSRDYDVHVLGLTLSVKGLAWQQQDTGVSACATIALWTMLHASALDDHHAIPTTADITRAAHASYPTGARVFPAAGGLQFQQICEGIKATRLEPMIADGEIQGAGISRTFSLHRFTAQLACLIRSGYPVLLACHCVQRGVPTGGHAVCVVGFRETASPADTNAGKAVLPDSEIKHIYLHDDNIGPNSRFKITTCSRKVLPAVGMANDPNGYVVLERDPPPRSSASTSPLKHTDDLDRFLVPFGIVAAVHEDLRMNALRLHDNGALLAGGMAGMWNHDLTFTARFLKGHDYVEEVIGHTLGTDRASTKRIRRAIYDQVDPMSLLVGLVRIGYESIPLVDFLFDTTGLDCQARVFCQVAYFPWVKRELEVVRDVVTASPFHWDVGPTLLASIDRARRTRSSGTSSGSTP